MKIQERNYIETVKKKLCGSFKNFVLEVFNAQKEKIDKISAGMGLASADRDDIRQDVLVEILKEKCPHSERRLIEMWIVKVAVNKCLNEHRKRKRFKNLMKKMKRNLLFEKISESPLKKSIKAEEISVLHRELEKMDRNLLMPMVLKYFAGYDSGQIGEILDIPSSTVRGRIRDGRLKLAEKLRGLKNE